MKWVHKGEEVSSSQVPREIFGFTYIITYDDNTKYIGKKQIWMQRKLQPRKTDRVNAKRIRIYESKWREYEGSSQYRGDRKVIKKEILTWCFNKTMLTYEEMKEHFIHDVLYDDNYLNANIGGKFFLKNIKGL